MKASPLDLNEAMICVVKEWFVFSLWRLFTGWSQGECEVGYVGCA